MLIYPQPVKLANLHMACLCFVRMHHCDNIYYNYHLSVTAELKSIHRSRTELSYCFHVLKMSSRQRAYLIGELFNVVWFHRNKQHLDSFCSPQMGEISGESEGDRIRER